MPKIAELLALTVEELEEQGHQAWKNYNTKNITDADALKFCNDAINCYKIILKKIQPEDNTFEYYNYLFNLARDYNFKASLLISDMHGEKYYKKSIITLEKIPENERIFYDWRLLAQNYNGLSFLFAIPNQEQCAAALKAIKIYKEQLATSMESIPYWRELSILQYNFSTNYFSAAEANPLQKIEEFQSVISIFNHIDEPDQIPSDWEMLASCYDSMGSQFIILKQWSKAQHHLYQGLKFFLKAATGNISNYQPISNIYYCFHKISMPSSLQELFFKTALEIFPQTQDNHSAFKFDILWKLHLAILNAPHNLPMMYDLISLLELIKIIVPKDIYPNNSVKEWFNNGNKQEEKLIDDLLKELKTAYQPSKLLVLAEHSNSTQLALIHEINNLKESVNKLTEENNQFKKTLASQSIYQSGVPFFNATEKADTYPSEKTQQNQSGYNFTNPY